MRVPDAQPLDGDTIDVAGKRRAPDAQSSLQAVGHDSEPGDQHRRQRASGPGLWAARDGVWHRVLVLAAREAGEQLGQPVVRQDRGGVEEALEDPQERLVQSVPAQTDREQRVVVRPDAPGVVADGIERALEATERPHPPARVRSVAHQRFADRAGTLRPDGAGPQEVPLVGGQHAARSLLSVQRERVEAQIG